MVFSNAVYPSLSVGVKTQVHGSLKVEAKQMLPYQMFNENLAYSFGFWLKEACFSCRFYSAHSVCIPRFLLTTEDNAWKYSIAIISFNFIAFVFVAVAYSAIAYKATKRPSFASKSGQKSDPSKKIRTGTRRIRRNTSGKKVIHYFLSNQKLILDHRNDGLDH